MQDQTLLNQFNGYLEGSNITILDTIYDKGKKNEETGKYSKDVLTITFENLDNNKKDHIDIIEPNYQFYVLKDFFKDKDKAITEYTTPLLFAPIEDCRVVYSSYKNILLSIAELYGLKQEFYNNIRNGNSNENKKLFTYPHVLNADMDIEDHYRLRFSRIFKNEPKQNIRKSFFDIETDNILDPNDFPESGAFPVNALTYINQSEKKITVFLLTVSEKPNPQITIFENWVKTHTQEALAEIKNFVIEKVGGIDRAKKYGIDQFQFEYRFFNEEIILLENFFQLIHKDETDFILVWNMGFDVPYLYNRIKNLGYNPEDIMCDPDYMYKDIQIHVDNEHSEFNKKTSFFKISGKTVYVDQMLQFAGRRSGTKFPSYKLDAIGQSVAKVRKLDYSDLTSHIPELPYLDYKRFVYYNIMDTVVQLCIECETNDINYIYTKCNYNFTRYDKCHRQTIYLANRATQEFYKLGFIIGNNTAVFGSKEGKYPGVA